jgi:excisionase family DNA binding protein
MTDTTTPGAMTPSEVAKLFAVDPKTVTRWADEGRLPSFRTLGGHRRFASDEVFALLRSRERKQAPEYMVPLQDVLERGTTL